jgi:hypothetical protein
LYGRYVAIQWLVKIKTDSAGNVYYEAWKQPQEEDEPTSAVVEEDEDEDEDEDEEAEPPPTVLTKPKILTVVFKWHRVEPAKNNVPERFVMDAATYQRLVNACK